MLVCACACAHKVIVLAVVIVIICANVCINAGYYIISVHHMMSLLHTTSCPVCYVFVCAVLEPIRIWKTLAHPRSIRHSAAKGAPMVK